MNYLTAILAFPLFNLLMLFEFYVYWRAPAINNPLNLRLSRAYLLVSFLQTVSVWFWFFGFLFSKVNSIFGEGFAPGEECNCFGLVGAEVVLSIYQWVMSCTTAHQAMYILQINLQGETTTPSIKRRRRALWNAAFITFCSLLGVYTVLCWITAHNRRCPQGEKYLLALQHHFYPSWIMIDLVLYGATAYKLTHIHGHLELSAPSSVMSNHPRAALAPIPTTRTAALVQKARTLFLSFGSSGFLHRSPSTPLSGAQSPTVELLPHNNQPNSPAPGGGGGLSTPMTLHHGPTPSSSPAPLLFPMGRPPPPPPAALAGNGTGGGGLATRSQLGQAATRTGRQSKASQNIQEMVQTYKLAFVVAFVTGVLGVVVFFLQFVAHIPEFSLIACIYCLLMYIGYVIRRTPFLIVWCKWTPPPRLVRVLTCGRRRRGRGSSSYRRQGPRNMVSTVQGQGQRGSFTQQGASGGGGGYVTTRTVEVSSALSYHSVPHRANEAGELTVGRLSVGGVAESGSRTGGTVELQSSGAGTGVAGLAMGGGRGASGEESRRGSGIG